MPSKQLPPPSLKPAVAYAMTRAGRSARGSLGVSEQHDRIVAFMNANGFGLARDGLYEDVGITADTIEGRPLLRLAIDRATARGCPIIVARLDCLGRDPALIAAVVARVRIVCADLGDGIDPSALPSCAAEALRRRALIGERTSDGIRARRLRLPGELWGNTDIVAAGILGRERQADDAGAFAEKLAPTIASIERSGATSLRNIAAELTRRHVPTPRGGEWRPQTVRRLLVRLRTAQPERGLP